MQDWILLFRAITILLLTWLLAPIHLFSQAITWQQTNGPYGGSVSALYVLPNGDILAGTERGGAFRSRDNGETWARIGLAGEFIWSFALHPNGELFAGVSTIVAHTDGSIYAGLWSETSFGGGLFRSSDGGENWQETGLTGLAVSDLYMDEGGKFFAATGKGVFISIDGAQTWQPLNDGLPEKWVYSIIATAEGDMLASIWDGIFRLTGSKWALFSSGLSAFSLQTLARTQRGDVLAGSTVTGIYRLDRGDSIWVQKSTGLINTNITSLVESPNGNILAGTILNGIYRTSDKGVPWQKTSIADAYVVCMAADDDGRIYAGTAAYGGVLLSADGGESWQSLGLNNTIINALGQEVAAPLAEARLAGVNEYTWDALDLVSGVYLYRLRFGEFVETKKLLFIK